MKMELNKFGKIIGKDKFVIEKVNIYKTAFKKSRNIV